jgi:DNA-binding IclR family transcriptional regulator
MRAIKEDRSHYIIQKVCNALDVLEQFRGDKSELGVSELSRRLVLQKNNVFRLLVTLESRNYIERNESTGAYRLGMKNLEMGQVFSQQLGLKIQARPVLERLTATLKETSCLTVLRGASVVCLDAVETPLPVRVVTQLGAWLPTYCTAAGKVHLAEMNDQERALHLPGEIERFTVNTIVDLPLLQIQLAEVAVQGYALDDEEMDSGVRCVSVPIRDHAQQVIGALSVPGPSIRLAMDRIQSEIVPLLCSSASEISARLGSN